MRFAVLALFLFASALPALAEEPIQRVSDEAPKSEAEENLKYAQQLYERYHREQQYYTEKVNNEKDQIAKYQQFLSQADTAEKKAAVQAELDSATTMYEYHTFLLEYVEKEMLGSAKFKEYEKTYKDGLADLKAGRYAQANEKFLAAEKGFKELLQPRKDSAKAMRLKQSCAAIAQKAVNFQREHKLGPNARLEQGKRLVTKGEKLFTAKSYKEAITTLKEARSAFTEGLGMLKDTQRTR